MKYLFVAIALEGAIAALLLPIRLRVRAHFSLSRGLAQLDMYAFGVRIISVRAHAADKIYVTVNGKKARIGKKKADIKDVIGALKKLDIAYGLSVYLAAGDARKAAMLEALGAMSQNIRVYSLAGGEMCYLDGYASASLSAGQIIGILARLRRRDGSQ